MFGLFFSWSLCFKINENSWTFVQNARIWSINASCQIGKWAGNINSIMRLKHGGEYPKKLYLKTEKTVQRNSSELLTHERSIGHKGRAFWPSTQNWMPYRIYLMRNMCDSFRHYVVGVHMSPFFFTKVTKGPHLNGAYSVAGTPSMWGRLTQ